MKISRSATAAVKLICFTAIVISVYCITITGCKKITDRQTEISAPPKIKIDLPAKTNPFSIRNVEKAKAELDKQGISYGSHTSKLGSGNGPEFIYFKFDPTNLTQQEFLSLENDSTVTLMKIPFANISIYGDNFALDETKAEQLEDGYVYGVTDISNSIVSTLKGDDQLETQLLDTLVKMDELDTTLQFAALRQAGFSEQEIASFRICLFKRPHGFVRYWDDEIQARGRLETVRGMQVWALFFGIPVTAYTDRDGYYEIPWRFSIGSIMGTKAKNPRVNIKPLNTVGGFPQVWYQVLVNFAVGSIHVNGWVTPCQMRDGVDFNYYGHTQVRYWCQLLNAYWFHDQYCSAENINNAPQSMVTYAQWADDEDFGDASTPLLGHISMGTLFIEAYLNNIFGGNISLAQNFPNFYNLLAGLLPDNTIKVCGVREPGHYCSRLAQTEFHELGHASLYHRVGQEWYAELIWAELTHNCPHYCAPGYTDWGKVQVAESWAEFIGTQHAFNRYGALGWKNSAELGLVQVDDALEREEWFSNTWIPTGIYNDLIDQVNAIFEFWDQVGGSSISNMYSVFNSNTSDMCMYWDQFLSTYTGFNSVQGWNLFNHYVTACP